MKSGFLYIYYIYHNINYKTKNEIKEKHKTAINIFNNKDFLSTSNFLIMQSYNKSISLLRVYALVI
jgi:hypothetical protein